MENKEIIRKLSLTASLLELYGENQFKVRSYQTAVYNLERTDRQLRELERTQLAELPGVGKSIASTIDEINKTGESATLENLLKQTPTGILELIKIKGIGARKVKTAWDHLGIESAEELYVAAKKGALSSLSGFGEKTQEKILQVVTFHLANRGLIHYKDAHLLGQSFEQQTKERFDDQLSRTGAFRRKLEVIESLQYLWGANDLAAARKFLEEHTGLTANPQRSGPLRWIGELNDSVALDIRFCLPAEFGSKLVYFTGNADHLLTPNEQGRSLSDLVGKSFAHEAAVYGELGWPVILPELREGRYENEFLDAVNSNDIIKPDDIRGILHNHSTYSDGKNNLEEMARSCKELGYDYFGISDHSQTAVYANGLDEERIALQHQEIERLNQELTPFRILKGIESDILNDGSLDYPEAVLREFDFIVASIHFNINMDIDQATKRLITAIENPYTTILGHPTGRQLLKREGYPIDHSKIIDACARNEVVIELNAHPWRLDLDWRWVRHAMEKGVMVSINPDAHSKAGLEDVYYGVCVARKSGLTREMTFNTKSLKQMEQYLQHRKMNVSATPEA